MPASFPQFVTEAIIGPFLDPPSVKCLKEGLKVKHPMVFVSGIVTGGLELWEGHQCTDRLFRKRLWDGTFGKVYKRSSCWVQHMSLDNKTGMDLSGILVKPVSRLLAADYFAPGYFVWAVLIANLARVGYEEKNMSMVAYEWRLSFQNTERPIIEQDQEKYRTNGCYKWWDKAGVIPHSMGVSYFLHFMKWVEVPAPMGGGGGGPNWCAKHIKAVMNIGGPFLCVPKVVAGLLSAEANDIASAKFIFFLHYLSLSHTHMVVVNTWQTIERRIYVDFTLCDGTPGTTFLLLKFLPVTGNKNDLNTSVGIIEACDSASANFRYHL
ncbi:unnamed protein product [Lactuca saligna]|uniref:Uncharacterized protein n=1 Tax=Lactuca saligna TaxID=75948 RepID=A0AA36EH88_LACSI|nr:unnamed protein product [Lactuca saligna]